MPEKASELRAVMTRYLDAIDAEDVQDVQGAVCRVGPLRGDGAPTSTKSIARAKGDQKLIAEADARLKEQLNASNATARNAAPICRAKRFDPES